MPPSQRGQPAALDLMQATQVATPFHRPKAVASLGAESAILDTEVAMFDRQLVSRFEWLRAQPKDDVATPPMLMAFDLLEL